MPNSRLLWLQLDSLALTDLGNARKFKPIDVVQVGNKLGKPSVHGYVHELYMKSAPGGKNPDTMYVAKFVHFKGSKNPDLERNSFLNEVRVGGNPNISSKRIGPGVVAYYVGPSRNYGVLIMDNFLMGRDPSEYSSMYLSDYLDSKSTCPSPNSRFVRLLRDVLEKFYRYTKGYHGDLHGYNMQVIVQKRTQRVENVYIFDYGAHKQFRYPEALLKCKTLSDLMNQVNNEFGVNYSMQPPDRKFVNYGRRHIANKNREIRRSNANLLPIVLGKTTYAEVMSKRNNSPITPKAILSAIQGLFSSLTRS